jgi:hypothetical protein
VNLRLAKFQTITRIGQLGRTALIMLNPETSQTFSVEETWEARLRVLDSTFA